jgi:hypothetical protein
MSPYRWIWLAALLNLAAVCRADDTPSAAKRQARFQTQSLRGRVVWLSDALQQRYGIESDRDAAKTQVALVTPAGQIVLPVKDARGRGFWIDERLRNIDLELLVRRYEDSPMIQVIRVYSLHDGRKYELDYWCDICAIPMYELKECECCQGPTRLRERPVEEPPP